MLNNTLLILTKLEDLVGSIFKSFFNFFGAIIRWVLGTIWRTISNKKRYTFKEYLNGPNRPYDRYDEYDESKNIIVGGILFFAAIVIIIKFFL